MASPKNISQEPYYKMKKTLFSLLACATLVAPAMADNWECMTMYVKTTENDTDHNRYTLYVLNVNDTTYSDFATTLGSLTYDEFQTQYGSAAHATAYRYGSNWGQVLGELDDTGISTTVGTENIYATWVYNNGGTGDALVTEFKVVTTSDVHYPTRSTIDSDDSDDSTFKATEWKKFATAKTPEPATATLSLLALAGLAARRRRK